jgi:hypothetical protein
MIFGHNKLILKETVFSDVYYTVICNANRSRRRHPLLLSIPCVFPVRSLNGSDEPEAEGLRSTPFRCERSIILSSYPSKVGALGNRPICGETHDEVPSEDEKPPRLPDGNDFCVQGDGVWLRDGAHVDDVVRRKLMFQLMLKGTKPVWGSNFSWQKF